MVVSDKELDDAANAAGVPVAEVVASIETPPASPEATPIVVEPPPSLDAPPVVVVATPPIEPEDNTDRSKLGRKVAGMERQFAEFMGEFRGFMEQSKKLPET